MTTRDDDSHQVLAAEQALYRAMIAKDFAALDRLLSPELVYVHSTGVSETKAGYLAGVDRGLYEYESIASRAVRMDVRGKCAIMHGIVDMRVGAAGQPKETIHLLFVLIWERQEGAWRLTYRQATRLPPGTS